jgi:hypothetical protein
MQLISQNGRSVAQCKASAGKMALHLRRERQLLEKGNRKWGAEGNWFIKCLLFLHSARQLITDLYCNCLEQDNC